MLSSKTWRIAIEMLQYSHVPLLFSHRYWGLFWGREVAGTFILKLQLLRHSYRDAHIHES